MNIGQFKLDQKSAFDHRRTGDHEENEPRFYQDVPRMLLLVAMLVFAIAGYWINRHYNEPERVVSRSVGKATERYFRASIEGSAMRSGDVATRYRARQVYSPDSGIRLESDDINTANAGRLPYDALTALQSLNDVGDWVESRREDMYGFGTRHFTGMHTEMTDDGNVARVYEYWIDLKTQLPVRMTISEVIRDPDFEEQKNPSALQIFLNIRYFGWR